MFWQPSRSNEPLPYLYYTYSTDFQDTTTYLPPNLDIGPTWSSDSKQIAFLTTDISKNPCYRELWIWDVQRGDYKIAFKLEDDPLFSPTWSPDGRIIAFSGRNEIVFFDLAEQSFKRISFPEDSINTGSQKFWSPGSTQLIIRSDMGWWLLTLADEEWEDLGHPDITIERWTNDGTRLIVVVQEEDIHVMKTMPLDKDSW